MASSSVSFWGTAEESIGAGVTEVAGGTGASCDAWAMCGVGASANTAVTCWAPAKGAAANKKIAAIAARDRFCRITIITSPVSNSPNRSNRVDESAARIFQIPRIAESTMAAFVSRRSARAFAPARHDTEEHHVDPRMEPRRDFQFRLERPEQKRAENSLLHHARHLTSGNIPTDFAALLSNGDDLREDPSPMRLVARGGLAHGIVQQRRNHEAAHEFRREGRFRIVAVGKLPQDLLDGFFASTRIDERRFHLRETLLAESVENMFLGLEIVEEGSFADIRGVGDVLYRGVSKATLREQTQGAAHQTLMSFRVAALAPAGAPRLSAVPSNFAALRTTWTCQYTTHRHI